MDQLAELRKVARIIVGALIAGLLFFCILVFFIDRNKAEADFALTMKQFITIFAIGYVVVAIVASLVITKFVHKKTPMAGDAPTEQDIVSAHVQYQTELIIRSSILEGAGFFSVVAFLIDHNYLSLICVAACLFFLALNFPRENAHLYGIQRRLTDHS